MFVELNKSHIADSVRPVREEYLVTRTEAALFSSQWVSNRRCRQRKSIIKNEVSNLTDRTIINISIMVVLNIVPPFILDISKYLNSREKFELGPGFEPQRLWMEEASQLVH